LRHPRNRIIVNKFELEEGLLVVPANNAGPPHCSKLRNGFARQQDEDIQPELIRVLGRSDLCFIAATASCERVVVRQPASG
jgi:hypothetical protein